MTRHRQHPLEFMATQEQKSRQGCEWMVKISIERLFSLNLSQYIKYLALRSLLTSLFIRLFLYSLFLHSPWELFPYHKNVSWRKVKWMDEKRNLWECGGKRATMKWEFISRKISHYKFIFFLSSTKAHFLSLIHFWAGLPLPSLLLRGFKFHQQHDNENEKLFPLFSLTRHQRDPSKNGNLIHLIWFHWKLSIILLRVCYHPLRWCWDGLSFTKEKITIFCITCEVDKFVSLAFVQSFGQLVCVVWRVDLDSEGKATFSS